MRRHGRQFAVGCWGCDVLRRLRVDAVVFTVAAGLVALFLLWGVVFTDSLASATESTLSWLLERFGWLFVLSAAAFVAFAAYMGFSRYGTMRLGRDEDRPEFRTSSWVAMMFSAGMGIGLMFYGVAEPISHLAAPPLGKGEPGTPETAQVAMQYTYFHWALTPWAIYGVVGLALGYVCMRKGRPNLISEAFRPLIGNRVEGPIGKGIDVLAIWATLFGSATSLGFGAAQINSGLNFLWDVSISNTLQVVIITVLTLLFVLSATTGVEKGIQFLSNMNMLLAILLLLFILVLGPAVFIAQTFTDALGAYLYNFIPMSLDSGAFGGGEWLNSWTIFYWAWWISWAPFVGTFLARISRGRTIREYLLGVILVPSGVSFVWFAILGGTALNLQLSGQADLVKAAAKPEVALFTTLEQFPISSVTSLLVVILVSLFFVSGADAASVVMGTMSSRGALEPTRPVVVVWGSLTGLAAAVLLIAGGLTALQQAAIIAAAPFVLIMLGTCAGLLKEMRAESRPVVAEPRLGAPPAAPAVASGEAPAGP
jgi:choline/carnitine/betaine transport